MNEGENHRCYYVVGGGRGGGGRGLLSPEAGALPRGKSRENYFAEVP